MSIYLNKIRQDYEGLRSSIEGLTTRAAEENRELTETELRSVSEQGEKAKALFTQIEELTEAEVRSRKVGEMAASLNGGGEDDHTRSGQRLTSSTSARDRDPGYYRGPKEGGTHSFFADLHRSKQGESNATRRLQEHTRALTLADEGPGITPPKWLVDEWTGLARQGRRVSAAVRNIPILDAAPLSLPKQTAAAGTLVEQTTEETSTTFTDGWDSDVTTVTPKATAGGQKVTRVMLDSGNPAIDQLIWTDLLEDYDTKIEAKVVAALITAAGSATVTYATEAAWTTAITNASGDIPFADDVITTAIAVRTGRKKPADILVPSVARYGDILKLKDTTGRPLVPPNSGQAVNVMGVGEVATDGNFQGLNIFASDGITQYAESILVARSQDTILFESPTPMQFTYEQPDGPEVIRLGIWAYSAVHVKYTSSVERLVITAAS